MLGRCNDVVGAITTVHRCSGLSGAGVWEVTGSQGRVVVKGRAHPREVAVYEHLVPVLESVGVALPACHSSYDGWLVLEHVAQPLPRERWGPDPELVAALRALHELDAGVLEPVPGPFRPSWDDDLDGAAREVLRLGDTAERTLTAVRRTVQATFEPVAVVSGDPNPLNWRLRHDGRLVLLDWERIGLARPVIDLAIALPGLPSPVEAEAMVTAYGTHRPGVTATGLLAAKVWTVVEIFAQAGAGARAGPGDGAVAARASLLASLRPGLDRWLEALDPLVRRV